VSDAGTHFSLTTATSSLQFLRKLTVIGLAKELEPFDIAWFEEPVSPDDHAGRAENTLLCSGQLFPPGFQSQYINQEAVTPGCQLGDTAPGGFGGNAVAETLAQFGGQRRISQSLPPARHRRGELLEEMTDAADPAGEVKSQMRPHQGTAQPGPALIAVSISATLATPSASKWSASRHNAACSRLATCPGTSRQMCIGRLPIAV